MTCLATHLSKGRGGVMAVLYFLTLVFVFAFGNEVHHDEGQSLNQKRLLLHSDLDITEEFAKLTRRLDEQQTEIHNLTKQLSEKASGSTYTRWGRTTCPGTNTELVYKGYMGGTIYSSTGGGVNYLCLSEDPQWDHYDETIHAESKIVGVEYDFDSFGNQDGASAFFGKNIYNDDAPCAVCHSNRGASIMIPGRTDCYSGWTKEYSGYIVGEYDTSVHQAERICLDRRPETVVGGKTDDDEGILHLVEASCGKSLECPPYIQGREITCVVCTK